jgi:GT2 family glycosyltransferase
VERPSASVIVPFAGSRADLERLISSLDTLSLRAGDELIVADNRGVVRAGANGRVMVIEASDVQTPAYARNEGARIAHGDWLVFIDADTEPEPALLEHYFEQAPHAETAVLAGTIVDIAAHQSLTARHSVARARLDQRTTLERGGRPYAQTANCAVRRAAFEQVRGFEPLARAGEDADLCFRLEDAGWGPPERRAALVRHRSRETFPQLIAQLARHGSGAAWVNRRHPKTFPAPRLGELARRVGHDLRCALGAGNRDEAGFALLDAAGAIAFEGGRLLPNRPLAPHLRRVRGSRR